MKRSSGRKDSNFIEQLILYVASAALSSLVLYVGLRQLDPNRDAAKKSLEHKREIAKRLGRPLIQTNQYEDVIACDVINPLHIDVEFGSIGGLESIKQALYELVILPLKRPELFAYGKLLGPQKGVLLYGPPGTGKTMLAKAIARESEAVFINVKVSNLMSKWFGDAQKLVSAVFSLAYKLQPAIIFIDEVDSFLGQRRSTDNEAMSNMKTEFMALWDGFTTDRELKFLSSLFCLAM
jgi:SpoVK/Ycf46/Vps4 family AAA+-type ATPase